MMKPYYRRLHRWSPWMLWGGFVANWYGFLLSAFPLTRGLEWIFHVREQQAAGIMYVFLLLFITPMVILTQVTQSRTVRIGLILGECGMLYFGRRVLSHLLVHIRHDGVIAGFIPKFSIRTPFETITQGQVVFLLINASMILLGALSIIVAVFVRLVLPRAEAGAVYWGYPE